MTPVPNLDDTAEVLRVLGHSVRLKLLIALTQGERAVGDLEVETGVVQPTLSQQLGILRKAQLVKARREAKQVFYRIDHDRLREVVATLDFVAGPVLDPAHVRVHQRGVRGGTAAMFARVG